MAKKLEVNDLKAPEVVNEVKGTETMDLTKMSKTELLAYIEELKKKPVRSPRAVNENSMSFYLKSLLMTAGEDGKCAYTTDQMFNMVKEKFPEWKSEGRRWYISWYRFDLKRKGTENIPTPNSPAKVKKDKATSVTEDGKPFKKVKDMTKDERDAYVASRNRQLKSEGKAPIPGTEEASLPIATKSVRRKK